MGETEVKLKEHRKETETESDVKYTRSQRKASEKNFKKSTITEDACRKNQLIDWENTRVIDRESDRFSRWVKEAICIAKRDNVMNRDEGAYHLQRIWNNCFLLRHLAGKSVKSEDGFCKKPKRY